MIRSFRRVNRMAENRCSARENPMTIKAKSHLPMVFSIWKSSRSYCRGCLPRTPPILLFVSEISSESSSLSLLSRVSSSEEEFRPRALFFCLVVCWAVVLLSVLSSSSSSSSPFPSSWSSSSSSFSNFLDFGLSSSSSSSSSCSSSSSSSFSSSSGFITLELNRETDSN